ncbi:cytochrome P450 4C1-like isoform X1 [Vespula squamosa]|uniref:Cytochrome P450 4C1-like isoform X1 n=1 Tax=Vespula squamosa TaxID=30214 RepID=A0ABD1ZXZ7_VESSQ
MGIFVNHSIDLIQNLETLVRKELDIQQYVFRCTLDIIYDSISKCLNVYKIYINFFMDIAVQRILKLCLHPDKICHNTVMGKKFRTCIAYLHNITSNIIKEKKESVLRNKFNREYKEENSDHISLFMFQEEKPSFLLDFSFE